MALVSIREYARQRSVSHVTVLKAVKAGKIPTVDGKIDPAIADAAWNRNRSVVQPSKMADAAPEKKPAATNPVGTQHQTEAPPRGQERRDPADVAHELYNTAKARKEATRARREELDLKKLEGAVVESSEVRERVSSMLATFKNRLLLIGDELGDKLAATSDPVRCRELVDGKIHQALSGLSEWPANA